MEVQGPDFRGYDPRLIEVTRRLTPEQVKPNIFRGVSDEAAFALLMTDVISLSPEAKKILEKLKEKLDKAQNNLEDISSDEEFIANMHKLKEMLKERRAKSKKEGEKVEQLFRQVEQIDKEKEKSGPAKEKSGLGYSPLRDAIDKMIVYCENNDIKNKLIKELEVIGESMIYACKQFGVRIIILKLNQSITDVKIANMQIVGAGEKTTDGRPWSTVRGLYDQSRRIIVIGEEQVGIPSSSTIRHEFAHAFDHAFTTKNQRRLPLSVQLWNFFQGERRELVSDYAGTNPAEYFAESVEEYFKSGGDISLKEKDPLMYEYLEKLFSI